MFSSKAKPLSSPSRVSIEEANSHLKLVHKRVEELETIIAKQSQQLVANEDNYRQEVHRLSQTHEKQVFEFNQQIDTFTHKIKELEERLEKQNYKLIEENCKQMEKLSQILKLTPNLDKLLKLLNSLMINNNSITMIKGFDCSSEEKPLNGFSDHLDDNHPFIGFGCDRVSKKSVKYKSDDAFIAEEVVSNTSSSNTTISGQSPSAGAVAAGRPAYHRRSSNSKLKIGRSFNITANFSDEEESQPSAADRPVPNTGRHTKTTNI